MDAKPPGQAARVNPPFKEWVDVVMGRANPKSAGPTVRAGATSNRIEMPASSDVAQEVYRDPVPKRKPIPDGAEVAGKVDSDPVPKRPRVRRKRRPALKPKSGYKPEARALKAASPGPRRH